MCEECRQSPCNNSCPNAPEPKQIFKCHYCGEAILEGDDYYSCGNGFCTETYCLGCVMIKTAEAEE